MQETPNKRSWLCPTELDRMRVVEANDRVRRARALIWLTVGLAVAATGPWTGWWILLLFVPAGVNLALLELLMKRSDRPELLSIGTLVFLLGLFAAAIPLTGGANSPAIPLIMIPVAVAPMRFRGTVVLALASLTVLVLLSVTVGADAAGVADDPRLIVTTIALLVAVTVTNWALAVAEIKQRDAAVLDPLTGLLNRKALEVRAIELEQQAHMAGGSVAFVACDIDRFKSINDTHGHDRGDAVLRAVAYEMRKTLRSFELIYRLGGEEFLVVLPGVGLEEAETVAERLRHGVQEARPGGLDLTVSFGVSAAAGEEVVYDRLYKAADEALYRAKAAGRNRVVTARPSAPAPMPEPSLAPVG